MDPILMDADVRNADWLKTLRWDLPFDTDGFLAFLDSAYPDRDRQAALNHFVTLPAFERMPKPLKDGLSRSGLVLPGS